MITLFFKVFLSLVVICPIVDAQAANVKIVTETPGTSFGGVGIICEKTKNVFDIRWVNEGGPASKAGLAVGDVILAIDNKDVTGWDLESLVNAIKGKVGTNLTLTIRQNGIDRVVPLIREQVFFPNYIVY